ncbi:MAG: DUF3862 domain-containing protein [Tepidisphaeraceae bacterium]|jgi:hypothetical protein
MKRMLMSAVVLLAVAGCDRDAVDKKHYEEVRIGMTPDQVRNILGKGEAAGQTASGGLDTRQFVWKAGDRQITVSFTNDKVVNKTKTGF